MAPKPTTAERSGLGPLAWLLIAAASFGASGCAASLQPPPIVSERAQLGSVIIYRNGVAYFERLAAPEEKELILKVPAERVDDFLKSLSIIDEKTGEPLPISYPTLEASGGSVRMAIGLPESHGRLRITYVTESPAWKPTYRLVLGEGDKARLHGWAVVDNVSGEDWKQVRVGVGSTSALSFRYDLHSVRVVERETLGETGLLALAPPTGGSPNALGGKRLRVIGISQGDMLSLQQSSLKPVDEETVAQTAATKTPAKPRPAARLNYRSPATDDDLGAGLGLRGAGGGAMGPGGHGKVGGQTAVAHGRLPADQPVSTPTPPAQSLLSSLSTELSGEGGRIVVEGFAQQGDKDPRIASLARANVLRDQLVAQGVAADRIDAVGTGRLNAEQAARVVALDESKTEAENGEAPATTAERGGAEKPAGQAHFVSAEAMTIESDHSAMVSILDSEAQAEKVFYYDPISARGSKSFAFNAIRLVNPTDYTLDSGPFTVYADAQFLGEGLSEPVLPGGVAFIPYALDRSVVVEPEVDGREEIEELTTIQRGIVTAESRRIRRTKLAVTNRGQTDASVFLRHQLGQAFKLTAATTAKLKLEMLGRDHLFRVEVKAGETLAVDIEEWTPIIKTVDIRTDEGVRDIGLFLRKESIEPALKAQLGEILSRHRERANLEERARLLGDQMGVYRRRVDEINVQLVTLKKVPQAAKLRQHLAKKMEEISDKLQQATIELADLQGKLMTSRIELQDKLAELTLVPKTEDKPAPAPSAPKAGG